MILHIPHSGTPEVKHGLLRTAEVAITLLTTVVIKFTDDGGCAITKI